MFGWLKKIYAVVKDLNVSVDKYQNESIIQSLPTVALVNKAKTLIENMDFDGAEAILKKALDISKQDSLVYKYLGKIYEYRGDYKKACEFYEQSSEINPQDKEIWLRLGLSRLNSGNPQDAILSFEQGDKVTPFNTDIYTGWGMALMKLNKYALAHDKFLTASKISKYNYTAIILSAIMEIKLGDYALAEEKLEFLSRVAPNESSTYEYANLKFLKADYEEAKNLAQKSISINKQMLPAYLLLGKIYSLEKNREDTEKTYQSAVENGLECIALRVEFGRAYVNLFDFENAKKQFGLALSEDENNIPAQIGLALVHAYEDDFTILEKLKEKYGSDPYIQEAMGLENIHANNPKEAVECFKKALSLTPTQTYNYLNLARCYNLLNDKYKTKDYYEKFISENSGYIEGYITYSEWLISTGDFADAQRKLRKAEKLDKNNSKVLNLLFLSLYTLVKNNVCEYNVKEAIMVAQQAQSRGKFDYENEKQELEEILNSIQENN